MGKICEGFLSQHPNDLFIKGFGCHHRHQNHQNHHHHHNQQQPQRLSTDPKSSSIAPRLINIDENEVAYRAEGNANIVLSLPGMQKVLRIRKSVINVEPDYDNGK